MKSLVMVSVLLLSLLMTYLPHLPINYCITLVILISLKLNMICYTSYLLDDASLCHLRLWDTSHNQAHYSTPSTSTFLHTIYLTASRTTAGQRHDGDFKNGYD